MRIVTLTTDFGTKDYYSALLKAALLRRVQDINIVDISHNLSTHDILEAALFVSNTYSKFPEGTIHIASVENYSSSKGDYLVFKKEGHYFIGPNNGLFSLVFPAEKLTMHSIHVESEDKESINDKIGHAVACIHHDLSLDEIGPPLDNYVEKLNLLPVTTNDHIRATIVHVDHFGNVIINLDQDTFHKIRDARPFSIYYKSSDPIQDISRSYADVSVGEVLAFFNTANLLEIAVNMGNAHQLLNLNKNETIQIDFN